MNIHGNEDIYQNEAIFATCLQRLLIWVKNYSSYYLMLDFCHCSGGIMMTIFCHPHNGSSCNFAYIFLRSNSFICVSIFINNLLASKRNLVKSGAQVGLAAMNILIVESYFFVFFFFAFLDTCTLYNLFLFQEWVNSFKPIPGR